MTVWCKRFLGLALLLCAGFAPSVSFASGQQPLVMNTLAGSANYGSADGGGVAAKFYYPTSVALDGAGNLYVADVLNSTIRMVSPAGVVSTLAGSAEKIGTNDGPGGAALFNFASGVAVDPSGNVIVADSYNNTIRQITTNGVVSTVAGLSAVVASFRDGPATLDTNVGATFARPFGVTVDGAGTIYVADTYNNLIRKIAGGNVTTLAGKLTSGAADGTGTNASFNLPYALAADAGGNVYVADFGNNLIRLVTPGGVVTTIAGASGASFSGPSGIAVDRATNVYVADTTNQVIRKLSLSGTNWVVSTVAGKLGVSGDSDGNTSTAAFFNPWGVAVDGASNIYVGDSFNGNIRKINFAGTVTTLAGPDASYGLVNGAGNQARFNQPWGVAVDGASNVYVADYFNNCIRQINGAGVVTTIAGSLSGTIGSADGTNNNAQFYYPAGICLDAATNLYVSDSYNSTIRKMVFDGSNWVITTIAGQVGVYDYQDGLGTNAWFYVPVGMAVDAATNLYVADSFNNAIRVIAPNGNVTTLAGNGNLINGGFVDGNGTNALFNYPVGIAVDTSTNIYVADAVNNAIRVVLADGTVFTATNIGGLNFPEGVAVDASGEIFVANSDDNVILSVPPGNRQPPANIGGTNALVGSADGINMTAQFDTPIGLAVDASGNVYVADTANNTIRKGMPLAPGSSTLTLNASPSGFPLAADGTNYPTTPQFLIFATGSSNTVSAPFVAGYTFTNWKQNGTIVSTSSNYGFTLGSNITLVADYLPTFNLSLAASPNNGGSVLGGGNFATGTTNVAIANANSGYTFINWTSNGIVVSASSNYSVVLNGNDSIVANFFPVFTIAVNASPGNGGSVTGSGTFLSGTTNIVQAASNSGFVFSNWVQDGVVVSATTNYSFILTSNSVLTANFTPQFTLSLTAIPASGGTVQGAGTFLSGSVNTVLAAVNSGFVFSNWVQDGVVVSTATNYTFTLASNSTLAASFTRQYTIAVGASPTNGGTVSGAGTFLAGSSNTLAAVAHNGFVFSSWTTNGVFASSSANYGFVLNTNINAVAQFVTSPPQITLAGGTNVVANGQSNAVDFGTVQIGFPGTVVTFLVTNLGGQALNISSIGVPSGFILDTNFSPVIGALSNGVFRVRLDTSVLGAKSGHIVVTNNDPINGVFVFPVTGVVAPLAPQMEVLDGLVPISNGQPAPVNFGRVQMGQPGPLIAFTVTNSGGQNLNVGLQPIPSGFNLIQSLPTLLTPGQAGSFSVQLDTSTLASNTVSVTITNNDPTNNPFVFSLTGAVSAPAPDMEVYAGTNHLFNGETNAVNFGSIQQNLMFSILTFTVTNPGSQTLNLGLQSVPTNYTVLPTFPSSIAPGASAGFSVQLNAGNAGVFPGNIVITNNDPTNNPFVFAITGTVTPTYAIGVTASPTNGGTVGGAGTFPSGNTNTVNAVAGAGFGFINWTQNGTVVSVTTNYTFLLSSNVNLVANFLPVESIAVSASPVNGGTVSGGGTFVSGTTNTVHAVANGGFAFTNWTQGGTVVSSSVNYTFVLGSNTTLVANFIATTPHIEIFNGLTALTNGQTNVVNFGNSPAGQPGPILSFTVSNVGGLTLDLQTPAVPAGFLLATNLPSTILAGGQGAFAVQLDTSVVGTKSGGITITNSDTNRSPFLFPISGLVTYKGIGVAGNLSFGGVPIGSVVSNTLTISNGGNATLTVSGITYPAGFSGAFSGAIAPGNVQAVPVAFSPAAAVVYSGAVTVASDASTGGNAVVAFGYGQDGSLNLSIHTSGTGTVSPNLNGKPEKSGARLALKAIPGAGQVFSNWTGSVITNKNPLTFTMAQSTVLQANFVPNPFLPLAGIYNGLFSVAGGVTEQTAGMLKTLTVTSKGTYTGSLLINGTAHGFSGSFNLDLQTTNNIVRPVGQGGLVVLKMNLLSSASPAPQVTGTVSGVNNSLAWTAALRADLAANTVPSAEFTLSLPPDTNNAPPTGSPGGSGYALIANNANLQNPAASSVRLTGALADGTPFTQATTVSKDGFVPVYANLYGGKGLLVGWITLDLTNNNDVSLTWIHPTETKGLYARGFTNNLFMNEIVLSPWTDSPASLGQFAHLSVFDTSGDTNAITTLPITISSLGKVTGTGVVGTLALKTGLLKVTIGSGATKSAGVGVLLPSTTNGAGYILNKTSSEALKIGP